VHAHFSLWEGKSGKIGQIIWVGDNVMQLFGPKRTAIGRATPNSKEEAEWTGPQDAGDVLGGSKCNTKEKKSNSKNAGCDSVGTLKKRKKPRKAAGPKKKKRFGRLVNRPWRPGPRHAVGGELSLWNSGTEKGHIELMKGWKLSSWRQSGMGGGKTRVGKSATCQESQKRENTNAR